MTLRRVIHGTSGTLRGGQCSRSRMTLRRVIHGTSGTLRGGQCSRSRMTLRRVIHGTSGTLRDSMNAKVFLVQRPCKHAECWQSATCVVRRGFHPGLKLGSPFQGSGNIAHDRFFWIRLNRYEFSKLLSKFPQVSHSPVEVLSEECQKLALFSAWKQ